MVAQVPFIACLESTFAPETIDGFYSTALRRKGQALKTIRFKSFPKYLLVQMKRYYVDKDWTPKKMDVSVDVPTSLRLGAFRSTGIQESEVLLPDVDQNDEGTHSSLEPNATLVAGIKL